MISLKTPTWVTLLIAGGFLLITSEVVFYAYHKYYLKTKTLKGKKNAKRRKKIVMPSWAIRKARELEPPQISQEQLEALNRRKPPDAWNTVLIFPDPMPSKNDSSLKQLINFFNEAKTSIYLCIYLNSHHELTETILRKYREGLLVQVVTDYDTWTAHNSNGTKQWKKNGIEVRMRATGYLMHNKFAIIDEEAVLTGSLNWTKQGVTTNNENVMVSTDPRITSKYLDEFKKLWVQCKATDEY